MAVLRAEIYDFINSLFDHINLQEILTLLTERKSICVSSKQSLSLKGFTVPTL